MSQADDPVPRIFARLAARFAKTEERTLTKGKTEITYVTARHVMNRLDEVLGPANWWDEYVPLMQDSVLCRLTIRLPDGTTITKQDAGGAANMKDAGDDDKSMVSDSFKRAGVKFGIARYLYQDGIAPFVVDELTRQKEERRAARQQAETPALEYRPEQAKPPALDNGPAQAGEPVALDGRSAVNEAFRPAKAPASGADPDAPARDPKSREVTDLWYDKIGARGTDVRTWDAIRDGEVIAINARLNRYRVDDMGLTITEIMNPFQLLNHVVKAAVDAGADDPNPNPFDAKTGKRKPIGDGKKSAFVHALYQDREPGGWREWIRAEIRDYLGRKLEEAKADARAEAGMPDVPEADGQLVAVGAPGQDWQPGRE